MDEPVCGDGGAADVSGEGEQVALAPLHLLAQQVAAPVPVLRLQPPLVADVSIHNKNITSIVSSSSKVKHLNNFKASAQIHSEQTTLSQQPVSSQDSWRPTS